MRVLWSLESIARTGSTLEALKSICQQAGATCLGAGAIIHNRLNGKTWEGDLETLAQVGSGKRQRVMSWILLRQLIAIYLIYLYHFFHFLQLRCLQLLAQAVPWISVLRWMIWPCRRWWQQMFSPTERVMNEGTVLPGNLLKVYSFINHQVGDPLLWCPSPNQDRRVLTLNLNWCLQKWWVSSKIGWFFGTMRFLPSLWFYPFFGSA